MSGEEKMKSSQKLNFSEFIDSLEKKMFFQLKGFEKDPILTKLIILMISIFLSIFFVSLIPMIVWNFVVCVTFRAYDIPEITLFQGFGIFFVLRYLRWELVDRKK